MSSNQHLFLITANNPLQNLGERPLQNANAVGNLSIGSPTIEQMNAAITTSGQIPVNTEHCPAPEPLFGEHAREAANVIRKIFR